MGCLKSKPANADDEQNEEEAPPPQEDEDQGGENENRVRRVDE